ncbi:MAG: DUF3301 domain-containing protein [Proteobacteria bacterium]|nr:DUF3301 domain-containing protein [Pseudomonadota bacterium]
MNLSATEFALLAVLATVLGLAWRASVDARALAFEAARDACVQAGVQLLDDTVVFRSWRLARARGGPALERTYLFDYSDDGSGRRHGFVVLRGGAVEVVGLGPTLVAGGRA